MRPVRHAVLLAMAATVLWTATAGSSYAQNETTPLERSVKAAFLFKFAAYVDWPLSAFPRLDTPVRIGVLGDSAMASDLPAIVAGRTVGRRTVEVRRIRADEPVEGVHILFVARSEARRLESVSQSLASQPVLIVSESEGALGRGSVINFVPHEGRVRFEISVPTAEKRGLQLRSGLLSVAQNVVPRTP